MSCCEKKCNMCYFGLIISLIFILLLWNIGLTIAITIINNNSDNSECFCVQQMRNVIEQIARLYPDNQLLVTLDSGDAVFGTAGEIILRTKWRIRFV